MKKIHTLLILSFVILSGCYYDNEEELYPNQNGTTSTTATTSTTSTTSAVSYATDIKPLIASNCATSSCHVSGNVNPDLSTYAKLTAKIDRVKVRAIDEKSMPVSGPLSNANIAKLQSWIDAGTPNN